jgi:hypothetical protein
MKKTLLSLLFLPILLNACLSRPEISLPTDTPTRIQGGLTDTPAAPPTHTPIFVPTLALEKQQEFYEFLAQNGGCELPCLWGITPGETLLDDAFETILRFVVNPNFATYQVRGIEPRNAYSHNVTVISPVYLDNSLNIDSKGQSTVRGLRISTFSTKDGYSVFLQKEHFEKYSLLYVLERFGVPDAIYMDPPKAPRIQDVYSLYVFYEAQKIYIDYYGAAEEFEDGMYQICPNIGDKNILDLQIVVADSNDPRIHIIPYALQQFSLESTYPPEILDMKLDAQKIYDLFIHQDDHCFQYDGYQDHPIY